MSGREKQALDALLLAVGGDESRLAKSALPLRGLLREDLALERLVALDLSGAGGLDTLRSALVCLHFGHGTVCLFGREFHRHGLSFQTAGTLDLADGAQRTAQPLP